MSTQTIFEKLVGRKRQREQAVLSSYKQLVEAIANETEPDPEEAERMLAESGKTLDDLQADCAKLSRRMRLKASLDRRPAVVHAGLSRQRRQGRVAAPADPGHQRQGRSDQLPDARRQDRRHPPRRHHQ